MNFILFLARLAHLKFQEIENLKFELKPLILRLWQLYDKLLRVASQIIYFFRGERKQVWLFCN
jgi:hypothetical protein